MHSKRSTLLLTAAVLLFSLAVKAQSSYKITAQVYDQVDTAASGNILLLSAVDSSLISGSFFMDGQAVLEDVSVEKGLVKLTALGFSDKFIPIQRPTSGSTLDLGTVQMTGNDIEEFTVYANIPLFEPQLDGSVKVNVQETMLASSQNIFDVLSKSPGVLVSDGSISVVGKGEALIYLDGKQIPFERLNSIQVSRISKIEIITSPSSKYDAEGRAVINIITVPNHAEGITGTIMHNSTMGVHYLPYNSINLNFRKGKWSLLADYGITLGRDWNEGVSTRKIGSAEGIYVSQNAFEENTKLTNLSNYSFGVGFQIDSTSNISAQYSGLYNVLDLDIVSENTLSNPNNDTINFLHAWNQGRTKSLNHSASLNYNKTLDQLGSSLFIGGQYSDFETDLNDIIDEQVFVQDVLATTAIRNTVGRTDIGIITAQADLYKVMTDGTALEAGAKHGMSSNRGAVDFFSKANGADEFVVFPEYSNDFEYTEDISAGYLQYKGTIKKKTGFSVGGRGEYTVAKGVSHVFESTVIDSSYFNFFPSVSLTRKVNEKLSLALSYSGRINRPQYQTLDPFVYYLDSLTSLQGNPLLIPELTSAYEATINYKTYSLKLGYNSSRNSMRTAVLPGNTGDQSVVLKQINVDELHSYFASLTVPIEIKKWSSYNTVTFSYDQVFDDRINPDVQDFTPRLYAYSYNRFVVGDLFNFELYGEYIGSQDDGFYYRAQKYYLSAGITRAFMKDKLNCRFMVNDFLKSYRVQGSYELGQISVSDDSRFNTYFYTLSLTYSFGKLREVVYSNKEAGEAEFNRIKQ
jgi:hypothetical protein